ncbi:MAG TPA: hypothetical protein VOB72_04750 [Candidatus Dormibacteraeota bacterium]|nr:hypothetical protein [Candidatus Dormibacteraeota bacterium]
MTPQRVVSITVWLPEAWARNLGPLVDPERGLDDVAAVLAELADHAQQGVYRPGAWEREWLCQALGYDWLDRVEPDPEHPNIFDRPKAKEDDRG